MRTPARLLLLLLVSANARAGEAMVLSVEVGKGEALTANEVREAVERELGTRLLRPRDLETAVEHDLLVVDVERGKASLLFRPQAGASRHRTIALPSSPADGLRLIAWVALNLVRDQAEALLPSDGEDQDWESLFQQAGTCPPPPLIPDALSPADAPDARYQRRVDLFRDLDADPLDQLSITRYLRPDPFAPPGPRRALRPDPFAPPLPTSALRPDPFERPPASGGRRPNPFAPAQPAGHPILRQQKAEGEAPVPELSLSAFLGATQEWGTGYEYPVGSPRLGELVQVELQGWLDLSGFGAAGFGTAGLGAAFDLWGEGMKRRGLAAFAAYEWQRGRVRLGGNVGLGAARERELLPYVRANAGVGVMAGARLELSFRASLHLGLADHRETQLAYLLGARWFL